ncbi:hypothetical protein AbraIFM66951_010173 [Aspergillus brasiliensis]|uniref:Uncharacterized protein n=1 Tax=Aspergillus brasiliensis TaxID=319629 RepID=A0A9W5YRY4_9EURO|nr:hypothetical protein AbraCBS73388_006639 [Aspergillus brasiliensis]GKZ46998.1 hypothetical protein AbraIFM66951_010173 [Aspergillus brasiliensis]
MPAKPGQTVAVALNGPKWIRPDFKAEVIPISTQSPSNNIVRFRPWTRDDPDAHPSSR